MIRFAAAMFLGMLLLLSAAGRAAAPQAHLPAPARIPVASQVIDDAHVLSTDALGRLKNLAASTEQWSGYQFVTVIAPSASADGIVADANNAVLKRGVGQKGKPGVLLMIAVKEKQAWIVAGTGVDSVLPPKLQQAILSRIILPNFRLGNMERGIVDGSHAITMALQGAYASPLPVTVEEPAAKDWLPLGIAAAFIVGAMGSAYPVIGTTVVLAGLGRAMGRW